LPIAGHYITDVYDVTKSSWLTYDDSFVKKTNVKDICEKRNMNGYIFFYHNRSVLQNVDDIVLCLSDISIYPTDFFFLFLMFSYPLEFVALTLQRTICNQKPVMYDRFALACCALDSFMVT
jgi:hypothetical protein